MLYLLMVWHIQWLYRLYPYESLSGQVKRHNVANNRSWQQESVCLHGPFNPGDLADYETLNEDRLVCCPILQGWFHSSFMTAYHIFPYTHGQASVDAIFEKVRTAEDVLDCWVFFDAAVMVMAPDLPERPTRTMLSNWVGQEIWGYKWFHTHV